MHYSPFHDKGAPYKCPYKATKLNQRPCCKLKYCLFCILCYCKALHKAQGFFNSYLCRVQEVLVVPLRKMRRECSAVGFQVELQVSMTTMQQMNYKCDQFDLYLEQTVADVAEWKFLANTLNKRFLRSNVLIFIVYHHI